LALAGAAIAVALAFSLWGPRSAHLDPLASCARALSADAPAGAQAGAEDPDREGGDAGGACAIRNHPETFADLQTATNALGQRVAADSPADAAAAARQGARLARRSSGAGQRRARWKPVGKGPLHADDPAYQSTYGDGFGALSGRISDYAYDRKHDHLYAAVASGGVWQSDDKGRKWHSIGNSLPTQTVGSIAYSPAAGGTLIAVTGDNAFGGNTYGGLGVFRSTNGGHRWRRSPGVPRGAQGFKAAVDRTNPKVVYAATGAGLFRSRDDGRRFRNVNLPTGKRCRGNSFRHPNCFFANIVTDVVVQAPDKFGHKGGTVLAAVGWREGARKNFNGVPEAPANGLYRSDGGKPGTFRRIDVNGDGFAPQNRIGRVELGAATGTQQNHGYVYAEVQDAVLFNKGTVEGLDVPNESAFGLASTATPTYLNGIYVSSDFGKT
jgi:hypothetical protein